MRGVCGLFLAGAVLAPSGGAIAKDFSSAIVLPKNSVINYSVEHTLSKTAPGSNAVGSVTATVHYRLTIDPNDKGYLVRIAFVSADLPPGGTPEARARLQQGMAVLSGVQFQAANDLSPTEIIDWCTQVGRVVDSLADTMGLKRDDPTMTATRNLYLAMTPEQATNALLPEWVFPSIVQDVELDLGPAVTAQNTQIVEGGAQLKTTESVQLKSVDTAASKAMVAYHSGIDPSSANALARATVQSMQAQVTDFPKFTEAQLASLKIEQATDCAYEMDLRSGLATRSDCTKTVTSLDEKGASQRQTDHWIITQDLVKP